LEKKEKLGWVFSLEQREKRLCEEKISRGGAIVGPQVQRHGQEPPGQEKIERSCHTWFKVEDKGREKPAGK